MILQDEITRLHLAGIDLDFILNLPLSAFDLLFESYQRIRIEEKIEDILLARAVAHADEKGFKNILKPMQRFLEKQKNPNGNDEAAFLAAFGKGF